MIGYIGGFDNNEQMVLITLEIPDDAITNMSRTKIRFSEYAMYYCNKAKVIDISYLNDIKLNSCKRYVYTKHPETYTVNEEIQTDYTGSSINCKKLIQFYLSKEPLKLLLDSNRQGKYYLYNNDGSVDRISEYIDNKLNGKTQIFKNDGFYLDQNYEDDNLLSTLLYNGNDELFTGEFIEYYPTGQIACKKSYINGILNGKTVYYGLDSRIIAEMHYENNLLTGTKIEYDDNMNIISKIEYKDGIEL